MSNSTFSSHTWLVARLVNLNLIFLKPTADFVLIQPKSIENFLFEDIGWMEEWYNMFF